MKFNKPDLGLKEAYKLAKLIAFIPSITVIVERTLSALKRIKICCKYLRVKIDCLLSEYLLSIEKKY